MTNYTGIFLRTALGQANTLPRKDEATTSPDVICSGTTPETDPQKTYGKTYNQSVGKDVAYGQQNYIYLRGKNYSKAQDIANAALYVAYTTQLSQPSNWTQLQTESGANSVALGAAAGDVAVTSSPFVWTPSLPSTGNPYVLIGVVYDTSNPNPVPAYQAAVNPPPFDKWLADLGGVAGLGMAAPQPPQPKGTYAFSALINVGNAAQETLSFDLNVQGGVVGDQVSCLLDQTDVNGNQVGVEGFVLTATNQSTGFQATVAADFSATASFSYAAQSKTNLPAPTLTLTVGRIVTTPSPGGGNPFGPPGSGTQHLEQIAVFTMTAQLAS